MGVFFRLAVTTLVVRASSAMVASVDVRHFRLLSWDGQHEIGRAVEEREWMEESHRVSITTNNKANKPLTIHLPYFAHAESLGSSLWDAGVATSILIACGDISRNKRVMELGCGLGLSGLTAATNSKSCILTDNDEQVLDKIHHLTNKRSVVETKKLDWRNEEPFTTSKFDLILGSDLAYYHHLIRPLLDTMRRYSHENTQLFIVGPAHRTMQWQLHEILTEGGYNPLTDTHEDTWKHPTQLLLYKLEVSYWNEQKSQGTVPIAVLQNGPHNQRLTMYDHEATREDRDSVGRSF